MTTPMICLLIGCLLPYVWVGFTGPGRAALPEGLDNANPRGQQARLEGLGARACAAQANAWEALPIFVAAVFIHHATGGDPALGSSLAIGWVILRLVHGTAYLANVWPLRTLGFVGALGCAIAMMTIT
jgi:uncharacterized MAPEG superfamily protein